MNFQGLATIEKPDFYLEIARKRADKRAAELRSRSYKDKLTKSKEIELSRITAFSAYLENSLTTILKSFPNIDDLPEFYFNLVQITLDYAKLKKSFGALNWVLIRIIELRKEYLKKITRALTPHSINLLRKEFFGRISSFLYQIKDELLYLESARKVMLGYPSIKTKLPTITIAGFPNVGKTTLLAKLTSSTPEINSYAFTTKGINVGYIKTPYTKIQVLDTPGTLNRENKMNSIEMQAYLAMKYLAWVIVYVFDPTETYPLLKQIKLFLRLKELDKPVVCYLSKTDMVSKKELDLFINKISQHIKEHEISFNAEDLNKKIINLIKKLSGETKDDF